MHTKVPRRMPTPWRGPIMPNSLFSLLKELERTGLRPQGCGVLSSVNSGSYHCTDVVISQAGALFPQLTERLVNIAYLQTLMQPVIPREDLKSMTHSSTFRTHWAIWKWLSNVKIKATQDKSLKQDKPQNVYCIHIPPSKLQAFSKCWPVLKPGFCTFIPRALMIWTLFSCLLSLSEMLKYTSLLSLRRGKGSEGGSAWRVY